MHNTRDRCISRQLWWGQRVPVWHKRVRLTEQNWTEELLQWGWDDYIEQSWSDQPEPIVIRIFRCSDGREVIPAADALMPVVAETAGEYDIFVCTSDEAKGRKFTPYTFVQGPDVLDTWASSWL